MSTLVSVSPILIESRLRCDRHFQDDLQRFYRNISPAFKPYAVDILSSVTIFHGRNDDSAISGIEFPVQIHIEYRNYVELVESNITRFLQDLSLTWDDFSYAIEDLHRLGDDSVYQLVEFLSTTNDFISFVKLMCAKYQELYGGSSSGSSGGNLPTATAATGSSPTKGQVPSSSSNGVSNTGHRHVRVLWDIENVAVPKKLTGLQTVERLRNYLESQSLCGTGIDCRITAFFNPNHSHISKHVIEDLDRGGVELVWVSSKREDADRKIVFRLTQEMQVLQQQQSITSSTTSSISSTSSNAAVFILISSDQDFRHHLQLLQNQGFEVIVIHDSSSKRVIQTLSLQTNRCIDWRGTILQLEDDPEVIEGKEDGNNGDSGENVGKIENAIANVSNNGGGYQGKGGKGRGRGKKNGEKTENEDDEGDGDGDEFVGNKLIIGWFNAKCFRWKGAYGFLSTHRDTVIQSVETQKLLEDKRWRQDLQEVLADGNERDRDRDSLRFYVNHKALKLTPYKTMLSKDEEVSALIILCKKGMRAIKVVNVGTNV